MLQQAGDGERLVAEDLGGKPEARTAREQTIVGVTRDEVGGGGGVLAERRGENDAPEKRLYVPAGIDELAREPVEQLGV
jgi:hypothetical protein